MSQSLENNEDINSEIIERSEEEIREEEIKNQQTINLFIESEKNWSWLNLKRGFNYDFKEITILYSR
mgnify:CR=1 FL=1